MPETASKDLKKNGEGTVQFMKMNSGWVIYGWI